MSILVTGGAGFIGCNFIRYWLEHHDEEVICLDKLTYAGQTDNLADLKADPRLIFVQGDICDRRLTTRLLRKHTPRYLVHFAAESHVDRSITGAEPFIRSNIVGTYRLLEVFKKYWEDKSNSGCRPDLLGDECPQTPDIPQSQDPCRDKAELRAPPAKENIKTLSSGRLPIKSASKLSLGEIKFLHVSTDEVYGTLGPDDPAFTEETPYAPNSPYAASKAASDHLVRAWHKTYGLPVVTTNCSNNYGPHQYPEKLIPLMIKNALAGKELPIYGDGRQVRDWLYVEDHCRALEAVLERGRIGETYNIGGHHEVANIDIVHLICTRLDALRPRPDGQSYASQIRFVTDRPGHDVRYAINADKIRRELGWTPAESFETGFEKTLQAELRKADT